MKLFFAVVISIFILIIIFSFYITRDGQIITPVGEGTITLDTGVYENFPLPDYAAKMITENYKSYFIEVEPGLKVHILEVGEGFPVFLMHGNPTSGFLYRKIADKLPQDKVRVIMPTSIGLGFSSKIPASQHTLSNHIRWINKVLNELQLNEVIYSGQDWGGPIGMGALSQSPNLLKGAVLLNTVFNAPKEKADLTSMHARVKTPILGELLVEVIFNPFEQLARVQGDPNSWSEDVVSIYSKPVLESGNSKATLSMMRMVPDGPDHPNALAMRDIEKYVDTLQIPAEIVWGMQDPILGGGLSAMEAKFPNASVTKTQAGHFLQEEVSTEIANALIRVIDQIEKK
tara:strand:+ start:602 stop:1633 length:1032 start_codon:yes stop_codon:yes gene_type:complete